MRIDSLEPVDALEEGVELVAGRDLVCGPSTSDEAQRRRDGEQDDLGAALLDPSLWVRSTMTISATASPTIAWRDWVIAMPTRQIQKQTCAKSGGHLTHVGRA